MGKLEPRWNDEFGVWETAIRTPVFSGVELLVETLGESDPLSSMQRDTLEFIAAMQQQALPDIDTLIREWVSTNWEPSDIAEFEDEDFT